MQRYIWVMLLFLFGIGAKAQNNIKKWEYWFNSDFSSAVSQTFSPVENLEISSSIDVSSLNNGLHTINYRFLDENEKWSPVASSFFVIYPGSGQNVIKRITQIEYWFDADYASAVQIDVSSLEVLNIDEMIDVASLDYGLHTVSYRFKDERGIWGPPESGFFIKYPWSGTAETRYITEYEYRVDDSEGNAIGGDETTGFTYVTLDDPANPAMISLTIDLTQEPKGDYHIHFRAKDSRGLWRGMVTHTMTKEAFPLAVFSFSTTTYCVNSPVQFVNESIDADTWLWDFGDGTTSTDFEPEHVFTRADDFDVNLTATDSESGRENTVIQTLTINPTYETEESVEICSSELPYLFNGQEFTESGTYTETFQTIHGCDSVVTLNLIVNPVYNHTETATICEGENYDFGGKGYTESGEYTKVFESVEGCDSTVVLTLTVNPVYNHTDAQTICEGETYVFGTSGRTSVRVSAGSSCSRPV
ncbi:MAG: PKD domain-containing protein, partial [Bacteroidales bacterium]